MPHRVFSALPFDIFRSAIEPHLVLLKKRFPEITWSSEAYFHLTFHFFSALEDEMLEKFRVILRQYAPKILPFKLGLQGIGAFPDLKRPQVLWVGLKGDLVALEQTHQIFYQALKTEGFPVEERPFHPHITLGRIRKKCSEAFTNLPDISTSLETFREIYLYESELSPHGTRYEILERFPLSQI